ncbi:MAG: PriCT-2 domain-containing protein [Draconibacterium sp.]|nr:PriCT-2 domain-containing protein [Draconibacterium sp.]
MKEKFNPEIWLVNRQPFNPSDWLPEKPTTGTTRNRFPGKKTTIGTEYEVEIVVRRVEASRIDLTMNYEDWLKIGFAFASEFGESGRSYFHRVSRFWSGYRVEDCNRQFDKCLKGKKSGTTIKTFFGAAYNAGINVVV